MVKVERPSSRKKTKCQSWLIFVLGLVFVAIISTFIFHTIINDDAGSVLLGDTSEIDAPVKVVKQNIMLEFTAEEEARVKEKFNKEQSGAMECPAMSLADLKEEERHPVANERHMITPPEGGLLHLVCCQTTKGPLNIVVHERWAPIGAKRFLHMVTSGYFQAGVPLFRCVKDFICQFGLNSNSKLTEEFVGTLQDDASWLPKGKEHRKNEKGVRRFARGYLAYAGAGPHSRDNQFIVSLVAVSQLAGGSPWEVPWGELVGEHSFRTLEKLYTGYGEDGPDQHLLFKFGFTDKMKSDFPKMDLVTGCSIVDQQIQVI